MNTFSLADFFDLHHDLCYDMVKTEMCCFQRSQNSYSGISEGSYSVLIILFSCFYALNYCNQMPYQNLNVSMDNPENQISFKHALCNTSAYTHKNIDASLTYISIPEYH